MKNTWITYKQSNQNIVVIIKVYSPMNLQNFIFDLIISCLCLKIFGPKADLNLIWASQSCVHQVQTGGYFNCFNFIVFNLFCTVLLKIRAYIWRNAESQWVIFQICNLLIKYDCESYPLINFTFSRDHNSKHIGITIILWAWNVLVYMYVHHCP